MSKKYKIWIDEAWRGPWLGPVVACALTFDKNNLPSKKLLDKINDSKKLSEKKREEIFEELIALSTPGLNKTPGLYFGVWIVDNYLIDQVNIKQANKEAMRRALIELLRKINKEDIDSVLIDWNDKYKFSELEKDPIYVIGWDGKVLEIWAASIIAKVFRDKLISTYSLLYPDLNLENHKWYGTKKHIDYLTWTNKVTWIHRISYKPVKKILEQKEKLLLHICCWPDATIPIVDLKDQYDITCFWYDPNIHPKSEYNKRLKAFKKVCEIEDIPYIEWEYDTETYFEQTKWLEVCPEKWERCKKCYDFRLKRTLEEAKKLGIINYTTTLTISPHKDENKIFETWIKLNKTNKEQFLFLDFKKNDWFKRSIEYTKINNIYRQNYCGCVYSKKN